MSLNNAEKAKELSKALHAGSYVRLSELLNDGTDANCPLPEISEPNLGNRPGEMVRTNMRPLHLATANRNTKNRLKNMRKLLAHGADVNAADDLGLTPMHDAASGNETEAVELLLEAGARVNVQSHYGFTPLHFAAEYAAPDMAEWLISHGCDVSAATKEGETALHFAAMTGNCALVSKLLQAGADVNAREIDGISPLHRAAYYKSAPDIIKLLADAGADIDAGNENGATPLHFAAMAGWGDNVQMLLTLGADANAADKVGSTPLLRAVISKDSATAQILLDAGATLSFRGDNGEKFCYLAIKSGNESIIQLAEKACPIFRPFHEAYHRVKRQKQRRNISLILLLMAFIVYCCLYHA